MARNPQGLECPWRAAMGLEPWQMLYTLYWMYASVIKLIAAWAVIFAPVWVPVLILWLRTRDKQ